MAGELRATPNLNQKSRLFDPPKSKASAPAPVRSSTSVKKEGTTERTSASGGLASKPAATTSSLSGPNLNQKSRLFAPVPSRSSTSTTSASSPRSSQTNAATPSPRSSQTSPSPSGRSPSPSARSASPTPKPKASPKSSAESTQKAPVKKTATFSRIVICYCCGQGFSIHSVAKHYDKCRERRPSNYKGLPKEATCPEMPEPNKLPLPGESSTAAEFQAFNDEAFQIYKAHLVQCPWGCGRTTEPDRTAVHMRGCALRPKPPPKEEGEEVEGENKEGEVEFEPDNAGEARPSDDQGERASSTGEQEDGEQEDGEQEDGEQDGEQEDGQGDINNNSEEKQEEGAGVAEEEDAEADVASASQSQAPSDEQELSTLGVNENTAEC